MPELPILSHDAVLSAVDAAQAIDHVRRGFISYARGDWSMPPKIYLENPPFGDFRAMPALGGGIALLKWISSFPGAPERGLPTVSGVICLSDAETGAPLMVLDGRSVTALRTGASAAVAARAIAREDAKTVGIIGCGLHGAWAARCMVAEGYGPGICFDPNEQAAKTLADELGWEVGDLDAARSADVVCAITPGGKPVIEQATLRPGMHLNMLGADGPGKAEATIEAVTACELFCDEWAQASHGGELTGAVEAGKVSRDDVTEIGAILTGKSSGRSGSEAITLFDSTGLAIQDLAVAVAALEAWRGGSVQAQTVSL